MMRKVLLGLIFVSSACASDHSGHHAQPERVFRQRVCTVDIEIDEGNIKIEGLGAEGPADSLILSRPGKLPCNDVVELSDAGCLSLVNKKKLGGCPCDYVVKVPSDAVLTIKSGTSNVEIEHMIGELNLTNGSGKFTTLGSLGRSKIKLGSGDVVMRDIENDSDVRVGSGNVTVSYARIPERSVNVKVAVGAGNTTVDLPEGSKVGFSGINPVHSDFISSDEDLNFLVELLNGFGSSCIKKSRL